MIYVCSDIHAEYDLFIKLLQRINFSSKDEMYICGDVIDKGRDSVRLLQLVMNTPNIHFILGNHEYEFLKKYWSIMQNSPKDFNAVLRSLQNYFPYDGHLLDWDTVDFLETSPAYIETESFICVHGGLPLDTNGAVLPLQNASVNQLVYDRRFKEPTVLPKTEKCIFYGHTPTTYLTGESKIIKYKKIGKSGDTITDYCKIHLDVGSWINGIFGCFCVDTCEEFYVSNK